MVKDIFTKKDKHRLYERLMPYVAKRLQRLSDEYTYREIAEICDIDPARITQAVKEQYLNEATLRSFLGGEVIRIKDIKANVELSRKDSEYLDNLAATSHPIIIRRVRRLIEKFGMDSTITKFDQLLKEGR
jgi:hypothetical protein